MKQFKISKNYTNRSEESLDRYLVEISRMPMITPDQEVELAQIIRKGGKKGEEEGIIRKEGDACQASFLEGCPHNLRHSIWRSVHDRKVSLLQTSKVKFFSAEPHGFFSVGKTRAKQSFPIGWGLYKAQPPRGFLD